MKRSTAVSLLVVGALGLAVWGATRGPRRTPEESFALLDSRIAAGVYDRETALGSLDRALSEAEDLGLDDLCEKIRLARGRLLMEIGAYDRARSDIEAVGARRPGDRPIEELLIELETRAGDFRAGLARVERMLAQDPDDAGAWKRRGELHELAAERRLEGCRKILERALVSEQVAKGAPLVERAGALDPMDARRVAVEHDLRALFGFAYEREAEEVLRGVDEASVDLREARAALARALELSFEPEALAHLVELLRRAGRLELGLDLAGAALHRAAARVDPETNRFLIRGLGELGRNGFGSQLAVEWLRSKRPAPPEFWHDCLRVLWAARDSANTIEVAQRLQQVGNPLDADVASLYIGLALSEQKQWTGTRIYLHNFISSKTPDPFPNARALAWNEIAKASRAEGFTAEEREALEGATALQPDLSGELWLRLSELQIAAPHSGYRVPEQRMAIGISMLPLRAAELLPRWIEIGELELEAAGVDPEVIAQEISQGRPPAPSADPSAYELYMLARACAEAEDHARALEFATQLLRQVPGFLPAIDLALDEALAQGNRRLLLEHLVERLRLVGLDERGAELLRVVPSDLMQPRDMLTVLRSDPEKTGRFLIARTLARAGNAEEARGILERAGIEGLGDEGRVLAAELSLSLREPERALELLAPMRDRLKGGDKAFGIFVDAALQSGEQEDLDDLIARIATTEEPVRKLWVDTAEKLLAGGSPQGAEALLRRLERGAPKLRGGEVLVRLAAADAVRGETEDAAKTLERALAFDTKGEAEFVALLLLFAEDGSEGLKEAISSLRLTPIALTPLQKAALDALAGKLDQAQAVIDETLRRNAADPSWQVAAIATRALAGETHEPDPLLFGDEAPDQAKKLLKAVPPQRLLAWLVAMPSRLGAGWARAELEALSREEAGDLWPEYLAVALARNQSQVVDARARLLGLIESHPTSKPAWDALDQLLFSRRPDAPERAQLRIRRMAALPESLFKPAERWHDRALLHQFKGESELALRCIRQARDLDPDTPMIEAKLGEIAGARGELAESAAAWKAACLASNPGTNQRWIAACLAAYAEAGHVTPPAVPRGQWAEDLELLRARHPDDPRIVVAQAELDLEREELKPTFLVARAYARLDQFREGHPEQALENLAPGSLQGWTEFYLALDPGRAEKFLEGELALEPGSLPGWALLGRVRAAAGKPKQSLEDLALAQRIAPSGAVMRQYLRVKLRGDLDPAGADALVSQIVRLEGRDAPDPELAVLQARAHLQRGPSSAGAAADILAGVLAHEGLAPSVVSSAGRDYALALLGRGTDEDLAKAREVLGVVTPLTNDPYERDLVRACFGLTGPETIGGTGIGKTGGTGEQVAVKPK